MDKSRDQLTGPITLQGQWWLPEHEEHKVFGTFTWDATTGGALQLQDELRPVMWLDNVLADGSVQTYRAPRGTTPVYPIIFGKAQHRAYTLLDAFPLSTREYDVNERVEKIHVNRYLGGAWFNDPDQPLIDRLGVTMRHLTGWVNQSGIQVEWPGAEGSISDVYAVVTARFLPSLVTELQGIRVALQQELSPSGDRTHDQGITQRWSLILQSPAVMPLDTLVETARGVQDLVTIAVGKSACFENVTLQHPDLLVQSLAGTPIGDLRDNLDYHARWTPRSEPCDPVARHDMYFTLDDLGGIGGVRRWLDVAKKYRTELARVMATRYNDSMFLEDRIMNASAALDSFDTVRSGGPKNTKYEKRIKRCVDLAGPSFQDLIDPDEQAWVLSVVKARHDLAHHREGFRTAGSVGDHLLAEQLFWLVAMCMLRVAEAPVEVFESISSHAQIRWLRERAQTAAIGTCDV